MTEFNLALLAIGTLVLGIGLISRLVRHSLLSEPILALLFGVIAGPVGLNWLNLSDWGEPTVVLEQTARLTLAFGLMGVALRLPRGYPVRQWYPLTILLGLGMPLMWLFGSAIAHSILGISWLDALLIGAIVTPTDPVVATSIVTGELAHQYLPASLRHAISAESGANDGLAYPLVLLPILLKQRPPSDVPLDWLGRVLVWEVGFAIVLGILLGLAAGYLLEWAERWDTIEKNSFLTYTVALSLTALGLAKLLGSDGILAVFVTGLAFGTIVSAQERAQEERVQEAFDRFFTLPIFALLGASLPWQEWVELGWRGVTLAVAILLFRRLPVLWLLAWQLGKLRRPRNIWFMGWFGPIGIAALYYANFVHRQTGLEDIWIVSSLVICTSIVVHGITATPFTLRYGRWAERS